MKEIVSAVMDAIHSAGMVEVEVSARHVHLSQEHVEFLFGPGATLTNKRPLSQPGQFLAEQRVTLIGPKGTKERVAVLGPVRSATQVELSQSDAMALGVKAPLRESGDVKGSGAIIIQGPCGTLELREGAGFEVTEILDEPSAANAIYQIENGVVVDIGGGTTGLAMLKDGVVVQTEDEPTGGTHLSLVLAGNYHISFAEAEAIKQDYARHREILPVVRPVLEKMACIVKRYVSQSDVDTIYLCGGTCCLTGIEQVFEKVTGIHTVKPANPFLVTPTGIAMNCKI